MTSCHFRHPSSVRPSSVRRGLQKLLFILAVPIPERGLSRGLRPLYAYTELAVLTNGSAFGLAALGMKKTVTAKVISTKKEKDTGFVSSLLFTKKKVMLFLSLFTPRQCCREVFISGAPVKNLYSKK